MDIIKQELLRHIKINDELNEAGVIIDNIDIVVCSDKFLIKLETRIQPKKVIDYFVFSVDEKKRPDLSKTFYLDFDWEKFGFDLKVSPYMNQPKSMIIERWIYEDPNNVGFIHILVYCKKD